MFILGIDTALTGCHVGIYDLAQELMLAQISKDEEYGQADILMPMILQACAGADMSLADIGRIVVTRGPGAFTGMRIGIAAAKSLALALSIPVIGLSSFDAVYQGGVESMGDDAGQKPCCVILDTKRSDFYVKFYNYAARQGEGEILAFDDIFSILKDKSDMIVMGNALTRFEQEKELKNIFLEIKKPPIVNLCKNAALMKSEDVLPFYIRPPDVSFPKSI